MASILVLTKGVLFSRRNERPIYEGTMVVQTLASGIRTVLATDSTREALEHSLRAGPLLDMVADIIDASVDLPPLPLWQRQIEYARVENPTLIVLTDDPAIVEWCLGQGVIGLLFSHPGTSGPARRPQQGNRKWESLLEELAARR